MNGLPFLWKMKGLRQRSPALLAPGTSFVKDNFSTNRVLGYGDRCKRSLAPSIPRLLLPFGCAARFLTGHGPVLVHGLGVGDPWLNVSVGGIKRQSRTTKVHRLFNDFLLCLTDLSREL